MPSRYIPKYKRNQNQLNKNTSYSGTTNWNSNRNNSYVDDDHPFKTTEEEINFYQEETNNFMKDTLATSRNILRKISETEQIGVKNMNLLAESGERLHIIKAKANNVSDKTEIANQHTSELKILNKFFLNPTSYFFSRKKKEKKEQKLNETIEHREKEIECRKEAMEKKASNPSEIQQDYQNGNPLEEKKEKKGKKNDLTPPSTQSSLFIYNKDHADAQEIDHNLDIASAGIQNLKIMLLSMNKTLTEQNEFISNELTPAVETVSSKINHANKRIEKIQVN